MDEGEVGADVPTRIVAVGFFEVGHLLVCSSVFDHFGWLGGGGEGGWVIGGVYIRVCL